MRRGASPEGKIHSQRSPEGFERTIEGNGQDLLQGCDIIFRPVPGGVSYTKGFGQVRELVVFFPREEAFEDGNGIDPRIP